MNRQKVFNKVRDHLLTQKVRSQTLTGTVPSCLYRGPNGTKCAIGILIKDEFLDPRDNKAALWGIVPTLEKSLETTLSMEETEFLADLQQIHDATEVENWKDALDDFADERGLNYLETD